MKLRILVDDRWGAAYGISRYCTELLARLEAVFDIVKISQTVSIRDPFSPWKLSAAIRSGNGTVFWSPGFIPPSSSAIPFVFTLHDLTHLHTARGLRAAYFNLVVKPLCRKASRIATVSEFSKAEICEWANISDDRVVVIPNGVSRSFTPDGSMHKPGFPYFLYVGNHLPHKNLARTVAGFARADLEPETRFLLTGSPDPELMKLVARLGVQDRVQFAGVIPESRLPDYYRGALAVALLSTNEGFGLPVLEAMASGVPVLAADATSIPEIAGGAALLVDPLRIDAIAEGVTTIAHNSEVRTLCRQKGLKQSQKFDWDRSAEQLQSVLVRAADMSFRT